MNPDIVLAANQDDIIDLIHDQCKWTDSSIPIDIREDCMLNYVNCAVGPGGKISFKDLNKCIEKRKKEHSNDDK